MNSSKRNSDWIWMTRIPYISSKISSMKVLVHCFLKWLRQSIGGLSIGVSRIFSSAFHGLLVIMVWQQVSLVISFLTWDYLPVLWRFIWSWEVKLLSPFPFTKSFLSSLVRTSLVTYSSRSTNTFLFPVIWFLHPLLVNYILSCAISSTLLARKRVSSSLFYSPSCMKLISLILSVP